MTYTTKAKEYNSKCVFSDCRECESVRMFASFLDAQDQEHKEECCEVCKGYCKRGFCPCHKEECLVCEPGEYVCDKHKPQEKPVCEHMWTAVSLDLPTSVHRCMKCGVMKEWGVVKDAKPLPSQQVEELDCWLCRGMHGDMVRKLNEVIKAVNRLTSTGIKE